DALHAANTGGAYEAAWDLVAAAPQTVALLAKKLRPMQSPAPGQVERLIKDLASDRFEVRARAEKELEAFAELAAEELTKAAEKGASLEVRQRAERLLKAIVSTSGERLRTLRAVEVLEACGVEARPVLTTLAGGAPGARLTRDARSALARLAARAAAP